MITSITKVQADLIRESGHNSPSNVDGAKRKAFNQEFTAIRDALASQLASRYRFGYHAGDELFLVSDIFPTRVLYLEVSSLAVLTPAFPAFLSTFLASRLEDYRIAVCEAEGFLRAADGTNYPSFYLAVTKAAILLYTELAETLTRFVGNYPVPKPNQSPHPPLAFGPRG